MESKTLDSTGEVAHNPYEDLLTSFQAIPASPDPSSNLHVLIDQTDVQILFTNHVIFALV